MKKFNLLLLLLILITASYAQTVDWVNYGGGINNDRLADLTVDAFGNVFATGQLGNNADFNGAEINGGFFLSKYDSMGVQQWVIAYGDTNSCGKGICTDHAGNIYTVGWIDSSFQAGDTLLTTKGEHDMIFMKFSPAGALKWIKQFGGSASDRAIKIICDENDHLYLTGYFSDTATIGNFLVTAHGEAPDIFLARSDTAGNILWVNTAGGNGDDEAYALTADGNGAIMITGVFEETAYFNTVAVSSFGMRDLFIARYDTAGVFQWVRSAGSTGQDKGLGICASRSGRCYVTGNFKYTVLFGNYSVTSNVGSKDIFLVAYDTAGNCLWAKSASGSGIDRGAQIRMNNKGKLLLGGAFESTMNFGGISLTASGEHDIFAARYDTLGQLETALKTGGSKDDRCFGIADYKNNRVVAGGFFSGTSNFGNYLLNSNGAEDIMVMRMKLNEITINSISDSLPCPNQSIDVFFTAEGTFLAGNIFTVQLSNTSGDFTSTTTIGTLTSIYSGVVHATIPTGIIPSNNYRIRISSSNSQCLGIFNYPIAIHANPTLTVTGNISVCSGDSISLIVTGALSYDWIPSFSLNTSSNDSVIAFPNLTTTYNITGTDQYGCIGAASKTIAVYNAIPYIGITASGNTTLCAGQTVLLSLNYVSGTSYQWQLNGSNISGATNSTYLTGQTASYTCIGTNSCGESVSNTIDIIINPKPVVSVGSFLPVCQGTPAFALSGGLPLGGFYSGSYIVNGIFTPSNAGTFNVNYSYTDSNGCMNSASTVMQVISNPTVSWSNINTAFCETGEPFEINGATPTGGIYSGTGVNDGIFSPALAGAGTHVITYKYTNLNGCFKTITKNFVVSTSPAISFMMDTLICFYITPFTLTGGMPAGGAYYINGSPTTIFNPVALGAGIHDVVYRLVNGNCIVYDTVSVSVDFCVGVQEVSPSQVLLLFPNPSSGMVTAEISLAGDNRMLQIYDALGKLRKTIYLPGHEKIIQQLDLQLLPPGNYTVHLITNDFRCIQKLIRE